MSEPLQSRFDPEAARNWRAPPPPSALGILAGGAASALGAVMSSVFWLGMICLVVYLITNAIFA